MLDPLRVTRSLVAPQDAGTADDSECRVFGPDADPALVVDARGIFGDVMGNSRTRSGWISRACRARGAASHQMRRRGFPDVPGVSIEKLAACLNNTRAGMPSPRRIRVRSDQSQW